MVPTPAEEDHLCRMLVMGLLTPRTMEKVLATLGAAGRPRSALSGLRPQRQQCDHGEEYVHERGYDSLSDVVAPLRHSSSPKAASCRSVDISTVSWFGNHVLSWEARPLSDLTPEPEYGAAATRHSHPHA
jgi:hypothetical protein